MPLRAETDKKASSAHQLFPLSRLGIRNQHADLNRNEDQSHKLKGSQGIPRIIEHREDVGTNLLGAKDVTKSPETRNKAQALKMEVPHVLTTAEPMYSTNSTIDQTYDVEARVHEHQETRSDTLQGKTDSKSPFDDTASFDFEDEDTHEDGENYTMVYRGELHQLNQGFPHVTGDEGQMQTAIDRDLNIHNIEDLLGEDWQEEVENEHALQQQVQEHEFPHRRFGSAIDITPGPTYRARYPEGQELMQGSADTPSRTVKSIPDHATRTALPTKTVSFRSPAVRNNAGRAESPELVLPGGRMIPTSVTTRHQFSSKNDNLSERNKPQNTLPMVRRSLSQPSVFKSSRESDYPTSSEDELPANQSKPPSPGPQTEAEQDYVNGKRHRDDVLDHDLDTLKRMKYEDLVQEEFDKNPQQPTLNVITNTSAPMPSLPQQLENLGELGEEEQKAMFRKHNDEQWTQTGSWFIGKFQEDLRRLVDIRFERRKTCMKFENEIRQRQTDVEWHSARIDDELKGLKRGGGELIKGKDIPSRRGTPLRR